jgi:hypothetical protein
MERAAEPAAWERHAKPARAARCVGCRRPEGPMLAWRDGYYAIAGEGGGHYLVFTPEGRPLFKADEIGRRIETPGWRPITVELDAGGRCPRCAYVRRHDLNLRG